MESFLDKFIGKYMYSWLVVSGLSSLWVKKFEIRKKWRIIVGVKPKPRNPIYFMFFKVSILTLFVFLYSIVSSYAQQKMLEVGESMEDYIKEHHVENIEKIVHQFTASQSFLEKLLEEGHELDPGSTQIRRKDVKVGQDVDIYIKHFSEHQNFTMFLVPINFYSHAIYDTLLISVLEVSNEWLHQKHHYANIEDDSVRSHLLSKDNHDFLAEHMYHQALRSSRLDMAEVKIKLHESSMTNNTLHMGLGKLSAKEKEEFRKSWGLMKKILTHNINLNAEMNVYVFGFDDMEINVAYGDSEKVYKITPRNIFTRHHFDDEE